MTDRPEELETLARSIPDAYTPGTFQMVSATELIRLARGFLDARQQLADLELENARLEQRTAVLAGVETKWREELADTQADNERARKALVHITYVLGSGDCPINTCEGCKYGAEEARQTAVRVVGEPPLGDAPDDH